MSATDTATRPTLDTAVDDVIHLVCCGNDAALCGNPISGEWVTDPGTCPMCLDSVCRICGDPGIRWGLR